MLDWWPSRYTGGLLPILLAFSLYCWPSPYTVGLLPILLAFSLYCWPSPYTVGLLPILLAFSLYIGLLSYCWPSPYTVGLLPIQLAVSLYCWLSPYTVDFLPTCVLSALSLYCWPSPYTISYTVGLLPILLAFSLYEPLSIVHLCSISVPLFTMCIADLWDTHTIPSAQTLPASHAHSVYSVDTQCNSSTGGDAHIHKCLHHVQTTHADVELCRVCFKHAWTHTPMMSTHVPVHSGTYIHIHQI